MGRIFFIYAKEDKDTIDDLYLKLKDAGLEPWMDVPPSPYELSGIPPGADWEHEIRVRLKQADVVLAFLSKRSAKKTGFVQREYRLALNQLMERPQDTIYLIPVLLEPCDVPDVSVDTLRLDQLQWYPLFQSDVTLLIEFLKSAQGGDSADPKSLDVITLRNRISILERQLRIKELERLKLADRERAERFSRINGGWRRY